MSFPNRLPSFLATMVWEGSAHLSLIRSDPGNWTGNRVGIGQLKGTKWGVAAGSHPTLDIAALTSEQALEIFVRGYWAPLNGDSLAIGLDHCVSDDGYNAGPAAARRRLGKIAHRSAGVSVAADIHAYTRLRLSFLEALRTWKIFGRGWAARCAGVEAEAIRMAARAERSRALSLAASPTARVTASSVRDAVLQCSDARGGASNVVGLILIGGAVAGIGWPTALATHWAISAGAALTAAYGLAANIWATVAHGAREDALGKAADELE